MSTCDKFKAVDFSEIIDRNDESGINSVINETKKDNKKKQTIRWQEKETCIKIKPTMKNVKKLLYPIVTMPLPIYLLPKKQKISDSLVKFHFLFKKKTKQPSELTTDDSVQGSIDDLDFCSVDDELCKKEYEKAFTLKAGQLPDDIKKKLVGRHKENFAILVHGWTDSFDDVYRFYGKSWMVLTGLDWRKYGDTNVIAVDWKSISILDYMSAGKFFLHHIAETIKRMLLLIDQAFQEEGERFDTKNNLSVTGHSLGAHISGILGNSLNGQVKYICALDPAGLNFHHLVMPMFKNCRLSDTSAQLVHVLHTSIGVYGNKFLLGHADFFSNGGKNQPGCTGLLKHMNSHLRSINLFRYSLNPSINAIGYECVIDHGRKKYPQNSIKQVSTQRFGIHYQTDSKKGVFYIFTNNSEPYFETFDDSQCVEIEETDVPVSNRNSSPEPSTSSGSSDYIEESNDIYIPAYRIKKKKKGTQLQVRFSKRKIVSIQ